MPWPRAEAQSSQRTGVFDWRNACSPFVTWRVTAGSQPKPLSTLILCALCGSARGFLERHGGVRGTKLAKRTRFRGNSPATRENSFIPTGFSTIKRVFHTWHPGTERVTRVFGFKPRAGMPKTRVATATGSDLVGRTRVAAAPGPDLVRRTRVAATSGREFAQKTHVAAGPGANFGSRTPVEAGIPLETGLPHLRTLANRHGIHPRGRGDT
jgi:hypothetical protein